MTKKELEAKVAELEKEVQIANRRNDEYSHICKSYDELVDTLKSEYNGAIEENKKLKAEIEKLKETKKESVEETKVEANPEHKFKVGDRVKCVKEHNTAFGLIGNVVQLSKKSATLTAFVDFGEGFKGHDNFGTIKTNTGWWVHQDSLELVTEEPKEEPEHKFKVGDRVKCVKVADRNEKTLNKIGIVKRVYTDSRPYAVVFDEDVDGHHLWLAGINCEYGHGWWCSEDELELVKEEPEPKFKVGDRVKCIKDWCGNRKIVNEVGTIVYINWDTAWVGVEFDNDVGGHGGLISYNSNKHGHCWNMDISCIELVKEEPKSKPKFKVGDRVKAIKPMDDNTLIVGKIGTIKALCSDVDHLYRVEFDERINGHSCGVKAQYGYGWNCDEDTLELVKPEPKFRIGDRVRVSSHDMLIKPLDENAELKNNVLNAIRIRSDLKYLEDENNG